MLSENVPTIVVHGLKVLVKKLTQGKTVFRFAKSGIPMFYKVKICCEATSLISFEHPTKFGLYDLVLLFLLLYVVSPGQIA